MYSDYKGFKGYSQWNSDRSRLLGVILYDMPMYVSIRRRSKHLFRKYNAWGFDRNLLYKLQREDVVWVGIVDLEEYHIYVARLETLLEKGLVLKMGKDTQILLPLSLCLEAFYG